MDGEGIDRASDRSAVGAGIHESADQHVSGKS
jgi:hypothetical protein